MNSRHQNLQHNYFLVTGPMSRHAEDLPVMLEVLAGARGEEPEVLAAQVYENSCKMFRVSALETGESPGRG